MVGATTINAPPGSSKRLTVASTLAGSVGGLERAAQHDGLNPPDLRGCDAAALELVNRQLEHVETALRRILHHRGIGADQQEPSRRCAKILLEPVQPATRHSRR